MKVYYELAYITGKEKIISLNETLMNNLDNEI